MDKKIKVFNLLSWLSLIFYIGFFIFLIITFVAHGKWQEQNMILNNEHQQTLLITFVVFILMLIVAIAINITLSLIMLLSNWNNQKLNNIKKLFFYWSIILVTLAIPLIIFSYCLKTIIIEHKNIDNLKLKFLWRKENRKRVEI